MVLALVQVAKGVPAVPALSLVGRDVAVALVERVEEEVADCRVVAQAVFPSF